MKTPQTNDTLISMIMEVADCFNARVRTYSGRGMFGERCVALDVSQYENPYQIVFELGREAEARNLSEYDCAILAKPSQDSMGYGTVLYWPSIAPNEEVLRYEREEEEEPER
jgi:hypothetical protein